eukprot:tig00020616_g12270.t1
MRESCRLFAAVLLAVLLGSQLCTARGGHHKCIHEDLMQRKIDLGFDPHHSLTAHQEYENHPLETGAGLPRRRLADAGGVVESYPPGYDGIRIHVDTGQVSMSEEQRSFLTRALLPTAVQWLQKAFAVVPVKSRLVLKRDCRRKNDAGQPCCPDCFPFEPTTMCGQAIVPDAHLEPNGIGVSADYLLYVTTYPTNQGTLAYAQWCQEDQHGRPLAGYVNIGPNMLSLAEDMWEEQVSVTIHEILHAMGFTSKSFKRFLDPATGTARGYDNVVKEVTLKGTVGSSLAVVTPAVQREVRRHFGCPDLPGALLENQGGESTAGSHWEKRVFLEEIMTGSASPSPVFSPITLALFEDSGWYWVNYTVSEPLAWGRNAGCAFVQDRCLSGPPSAPVSVNPKYFCTKSGDDACSHNRLTQANCFIYNHRRKGRPVPPEFQYFGDDDRGGMEFADFCPLYQSFNVRSSGRTTDCRSPHNAPALNSLGEVYCPSCRCFETKGLMVDGFATSQHTGCFGYSCEGGQLRVKLQDQTIDCPWAGGPAKAPPGYVGELVCPPYAEMCDDLPITRHECPERCSGRGNCVKGQCVCPPAWGGDSCNEAYCPDRYNGGVCNRTGWWSGSFEAVPLSFWEQKTVFNSDKYGGPITVALAASAAVATLAAAVILVLTLGRYLSNRLAMERERNRYQAALLARAARTVAGEETDEGEGEEEDEEGGRRGAGAARRGRGGQGRRAGPSSAAERDLFAAQRQWEQGYASGQAPLASAANAGATVLVSPAGPGGGAGVALPPFMPVPVAAVAAPAVQLRPPSDAEAAPAPAGGARAVTPGGGGRPLPQGGSSSSRRQR